jgi:hypothetical protein
VDENEELVVPARTRALSREEKEKKRQNASVEMTTNNKEHTTQYKKGEKDI